MFATFDYRHPRPQQALQAGLQSFQSVRRLFPAGRGPRAADKNYDGGQAASVARREGKQQTFLLESSMTISVGARVPDGTLTEF
ncbi:hypothetical protein, partial [Bordetella pseudohinzii]|uniref:hypothetical protein n=1 Tax=Bordetella pseudohinzii TaxID=1331258 RepID=UPI001F2073C6